MCAGHIGGEVLRRAAAPQHAGLVGRSGAAHLASLAVGRDRRDVVDVGGRIGADGGRRPAGGHVKVSRHVGGVRPESLLIVPVTSNVSPGRNGFAAVPDRPSIATWLGTCGVPQSAAFQDGAWSRDTGTPPRTVPKSVSWTFSSPLPGPPSLVTAIASVLWPFGSKTPFG